MPLDVARLRVLRGRARALNDTFVEDLTPFLKPNGTFFRLPIGEKVDYVSVTTSCTCLMAAVLTDRLSNLYERPDDGPRNAFRQIAQAKWRSSGLEPDNNFTRILALRAAGLLKRENVLTTKDLRRIKHRGRPLPALARNMAKQIPQSFRVAAYPAKAALGYWFLDAIENLQVEPKSEEWQRFADWSSQEFSRQLSYTVADHDALLAARGKSRQECDHEAKNIL